MVGTVTDSSGAVVVSAQVTATNEGTAQARSAQTDASGNYLISQLHPGRYTLSCELAGFKKLVQKGIDLQVNQRAQIDLVLQIGEVSEIVSVEGTAPLLESQSSVLGSVISETPGPGSAAERAQLYELAILTPGVSGTGYGARGTIMSGTRPDDQRPGASSLSMAIARTRTTTCTMASTTTTG